MFDQWLKVYPDEADPYSGKPYYMFTFSNKTHDGYEITIDFENSRYRDTSWKGYLTINDTGYSLYCESPVTNKESINLAANVTVNKGLTPAGTRVVVEVVVVAALSIHNPLLLQAVLPHHPVSYVADNSVVPGKG